MSIRWRSALFILLIVFVSTAVAFFATRGQIYAAVFFLLSGVAAALPLSRLAAAYPLQETEEKNRAPEKLNETAITADIEQRDRLLQTVNEVADILLRSEPHDFSDTLHRCMGMMASAIDADRMYLFKNHTENGKLYYTQLYEWSENVQPFQDTEMTANVSYDAQAPEVREALLRGECVHRLVRDLPSTDRDQLGAQGVLSIMVVPVFIRNEFWGFVGFDNCHSEELFSDNEESIMHSGSLLIASALLRNEYMLNIHNTSAKLQNALAEAEEANNAKSDFLANMSHEMRTPLNAIIGLSEIALENTSLDQDAKSNLEKIYNSGSTLLSIVNDVLDISKIQSGKFAILENQYDVPSLVNDTIIQNALRIGSKPIRFILDIAEDTPASLYGDELRVKQIINNLLSNAFKYTEAGDVTLGLYCERDGDTVWMTIRVSDTGIGMSSEQLNRLFTNYMQFGTASHYRSEGTGLGLVITKNLAELMNGSIRVESRYGEGSVFTVRLRQRYVNDLVIGASVVESLKRFRYSTNKLNRKSQSKRLTLPYARVLVVDDNVTNLDVARGLMKPYAMRVDCVKSGREAIRAVREQKAKYNAIFMDHMMPEMNGIEATRIIREEIGTEYARTIPIIALTANAIAGNEKMFLSKGFNGFISKPIDLAHLDEIIRRFIRDKNQEMQQEELRTHAETSNGRDDKGASMLEGITINGVDKNKAIESFGGDETVFVDVLRSYAGSTRSLLNKLREYLDAGNLEDYAITIHGIKGSSRNIAAQEVGKTAEALENAAKTGDWDTVKTGHAAFEKIAIALLSDIDKAIGKIDTAANKPAAAPAATYRDFLNFTVRDAEILMVEDNETNQKAALGLLKPLRMRIDTAENGKRALQMLREKRYHLIFMDHLMPVMDGIEATVKLRQMEGEYYQKVPVIALTANTAPDARAKLLQAGMNDFVAKPIEMKEICEKIKRWLPGELIQEKPASLDYHAEEPKDQENLPLIEGIDAREGIRYSGTRELFIGLLGDFYKLIDLKAAKIEKCLADGLLRDVTIEVHALKNNARIIGARELSEGFYRLERYGNEENREALERETPAVLERYRRFKSLLKPFGEAAEQEKKAASKEELIALLRKLKSATESFNLDGADEALKRLEELQIPAECRTQMETLRAYVADVAMEDVMKLAETMIEIIEKIPHGAI